MTNNNLNILRKSFSQKGFDGLLISSVYNISYLTGYFNFSGEEREAFLFITKDRQYILTDSRYSHAVKQKVEHFELIEISSFLPFPEAIKNLTQKHKINLLGIEEDNLTVQELRRVLAFFGNLKHFSLSEVRSIKTGPEINLIGKACKLADLAFEFILKKIKPGISEKGLAFELEFFIKKKGADLAFPLIIAFGKNSAFPHHQTSNQQLTINSNIILLDFGAKADNYCSDMSRTVFLGKASAEQKKIYQTVLEAQQKAIEHLGRWRGNDLDSSEVDTLKAKDIDRVARDYIISQGYPPIPHSLGHGIGLEAHEAPRLSPESDDLLKPGVVFSLEPGIYLPGRFGIRIEDLVVLEKSGPRLLTKSPKHLIQL